MVPSYHLTFTSQKGTPLLVLPMLATLGHRSGYLQDGAIVPSDLLTSQKGTPLLVHPMLHPNIGSPRDAATLGEIGSAFPATHVSPLQSEFVWTCLELNIKYWTSTDLNSMRWLGLFTNKIFRKHLKLIFSHRDFIICIVSLEIFHPHFLIRIFPSAFCHPQFSIRILSSAFFYPPSAIRHPPSAIRHPPSAIRRHPVLTLQRPSADASFVQSVKHDKFDLRTLKVKRTSNSYDNSSF